jgi:hypothetical protein
MSTRPRQKRGFTLGAMSVPVRPTRRATGNAASRCTEADYAAPEFTDSGRRRFSTKISIQKCSKAEPKCYMSWSWLQTGAAGQDALPAFQAGPRPSNRCGRHRSLLHVVGVAGGDLGVRRDVTEDGTDPVSGPEVSGSRSPGWALFQFILDRASTSVPVASRSCCPRRGAVAVAAGRTGLGRCGSRGWIRVCTAGECAGPRWSAG